MDKYINHDLGSIIEEHSKVMKVASSNKNATTIDLSTQKNKLIGLSTTYTDNIYLKKSMAPELNKKSAKHKELDRQSTIQRAQDLKQKNMRREIELATMEGNALHANMLMKGIQLKYLSESKKSFNTEELQKMYFQNKAYRQELHQIVEKGKSQNYHIARQEGQGTSHKIFKGAVGYR